MTRVLVPHLVLAWQEGSTGRRVPSRLQPSLTTESLDVVLVKYVQKVCAPSRWVGYR